ncbi:hypothetical protein IFM89_038697 [Coptis chinensis]|uniref:Uncharacterized protein n=1 Tax=Coptis chinensis TaxID=261450 RepID=A0A835H041_9MAGN|nr:hypothetical protein IFM89_038697 [Coptis chinensis]
MIAGYVGVSDMEAARELFEGMVVRDVVNGDVVDEPEEESTSSSTTTTLPELESLKIEEDVKKENDFLEEAEDTNITAVTAEDTLYSTAATFEDLKLSSELLRGLYVEMKFTRRA